MERRAVTAADQLSGPAGHRSDPIVEQADLVTIGKIERTFGVRGEVKVQSLSDVPNRLQQVREVTLISPSGMVLTTNVTQARPGGRSYIMRFEAFSTPEEAAQFRGGVLQIPRAASPRLGEDEYYEYELIGMAVRDEEGQDLGTLEEIWHLPGNPVFAVRHAGREHLIPATKRAVVSVDRIGGLMTVRAGEGVVEES
ncbi:MAG TPA: ribosome maturation factor RimM [Nitrospiraceae bacterium]|nr:ribosome maturation factor RimM [Nitrospiraceae bacterium]